MTTVAGTFKEIKFLVPYFENWAIKTALILSLVRAFSLILRHAKIDFLCFGFLSIGVFETRQLDQICF